jgi:hypothetical protein
MKVSREEGEELEKELAEFEARGRCSEVEKLNKQLDAEFEARCRRGD